MSERRTFVVEAPTRGIQTYLVEARSAAEAKRLVEQEPGRYALGHETTWEGRPSRAREDLGSEAGPEREPAP